MRAGSELRIAECTASFQAVSKLFNKAKGTEVRKMFQRSTEEEAARGLPELSKKAHQACKGLAGAWKGARVLAARARAVFTCAHACA